MSDLVRNQYQIKTVPVLIGQLRQERQIEGFQQHELRVDWERFPARRYDSGDVTATCLHCTVSGFIVAAAETYGDG